MMERPFLAEVLMAVKAAIPEASPVQLGEVAYHLIHKPDPSPVVVPPKVETTPKMEAPIVHPPTQPTLPLVQVEAPAEVIPPADPTPPDFRGRHWSEKDQATLIERAETSRNLSDLARDLGRSEGAIFSRIEFLIAQGVMTRPSWWVVRRRWTEEERKRLIQYGDEDKKSAYECAQLLGRTYLGVKSEWSRLHSLGLVKGDLK